MDVASLLDTGLLWNAASGESAKLRLESGPEEILARSYSHELFLDQKTFLGGAYPTSVLLPFLKSGIQKERADKNTRLVVFLGKEVWPTPFCLRDSFKDTLSLSNFLFINPPSSHSRQRSLEILSASSNVFAVITSLKKASFAFTQKLYLFSKQSSAYTFIFRDSKELSQKSAAYSRWMISPVASETDYPSWKLSLLHSKSSWVQDTGWLLEGVNEEEISVHLLSQLGSGSNSKKIASSLCA